MSQKGVELAAEAFSFLQEQRGRLFTLAAEVGLSIPDGKQDLLLAHMLDAAKDAVKEDFNKLTVMKHPALV